MINKMVFGVATFFMGLLAIGFIIFMIGVLFSNFSLMVFPECMEQEVFDVK